MMQTTANSYQMPQEGPMRALLFVGHPSTAQMITSTLDGGSFLTRATRYSREAVTLLDEWRPHLTVVDIDTVQGELLARLAVSEKVPGSGSSVLAVTQRSDLQTKLQAFAKGVDDIMVMPFSPEELLARARAVAKRAYHGLSPSTAPLHVGGMAIDMVHRTVRLGQRDVHLSGLQLALLHLLASNVGRTMTRDDILDTVWGDDYVQESNIVDRHVRNLRVLLHDDWRRPRFIATVPGQGYRFLPQTPGTSGPAARTP